LQDELRIRYLQAMLKSAEDLHEVELKQLHL
jgi:hypothetical protein